MGVAVGIEVMLKIKAAIFAVTLKFSAAKGLGRVRMLINGLGRTGLDGCLSVCLLAVQWHFHALIVADVV